MWREFLTIPVCPSRVTIKAGRSARKGPHDFCVTSLRIAPGRGAFVSDEALAAGVV